MLLQGNIYGVVWLLVFGCRLLVFGCWYLVVGIWLLVFGCRYWLPAKATDNLQPNTNNQTPTTNHYIFLSIDILFSTIRPQVLSGRQYRA